MTQHGYINLYRSKWARKGGVVFDTKEKALENTNEHPNYVTTTEIEWEE